MILVIIKKIKRQPQQVASLPNLTKPFYEKITLLLHITKVRNLLVNSIKPKLKNVKLFAYDYCDLVFKISIAVLTYYYSLCGKDNAQKHTRQQLELYQTIKTDV